MESILKYELLEKGFTSFSLKEFDQSLYNKLNVIFPINEVNNISFKHLKHSIRGDIENPYTRDKIQDCPFEELEKIKYEIIEKYYEHCDQLWYYGWTNDKQLQKNPLDNLLNPIIKYFYGIEKTGANSQLTLYNDGCYLKNHQDGNTGYSDVNRTCAILIYLSSEYKNNRGGELVLNNNINEMIVEPSYGNVAILDFTKHDVWHRVNQVKGFNRYCFTSFC